MNQIEFNNVVCGDLDTANLTYRSVRIEIGKITPSKLQILVELVKSFCDCPPEEFDRSMINDAVKAVEKAEFPRERIERLKKQQRIMKDLHNGGINFESEIASEEAKIASEKATSLPTKLPIKLQLAAAKRGGVRPGAGRPKKETKPEEPKKMGRPRGASKHAQLQDKIIEVLGESGPKDLVDLREAILPGVKAADPGYQNFYAALNNLRYRGTVEKADNKRIQLAAEAENVA
jgi:hypothetical protein